MTTGFSKTSLCIVYLKVFQRANSSLVRWTRATVWTLLVIIVLAYGASFIICIFECTPVSKAWVPSNKGTCIDLAAFRYGVAVINIFTSVFLIVTPLPVLFRLLRHRSEVAETIFLILLGLLSVQTPA